MKKLIALLLGLSVAVPMLAADKREADRVRASGVVLQEILGIPDDIGGIAVMLAAKAGAFITGQTIIADGGTTIGS